MSGGFQEREKECQVPRAAEVGLGRGLGPGRLLPVLGTLVVHSSQGPKMAAVLSHR